MGAAFDGMLNRNSRRNDDAMCGGLDLHAYPNFSVINAISQIFYAKNKFLEVSMLLTLSNQTIEVCSFTQALMRGCYAQYISFIKQKVTTVFV